MEYLQQQESRRSSIGRPLSRPRPVYLDRKLHLLVPYSASVVTCLLVERFVDFLVILQILAVQDATVTLGQVFLVNKTILDLVMSFPSKLWLLVLLIDCILD